MSIPEFIDSLADFGILTNNVTDIFDRLNEGVSEEVSTIIFEPRCEKTGLWGFRPGLTQTRL